MTEFSERRRLWIGNLDERLTEFNILKILKKYGEITQFDFLFHSSGPNQGKPRGYCFVSYKTVEEAVHALTTLDGKLALGKKLMVKWAHSQNKISEEPVKLEPTGELNPQKLPSSMGGQATCVVPRKDQKQSQKSACINAKIRAIESKLQEMSKSTDDFTVVPGHGQDQKSTAHRNKSSHPTKPWRRKPYDKK